MPTRAGLAKVHKDVLAYGQQLVRRGWVQLDDDTLGNPRYAWPDSPAVLTLPRAGRGRWRQDAARQVARTTGARNHSARTHPARRLTAVPDEESAAAELARALAAAHNRSSEQRRRRLMAAERSFNFYRHLMSTAPGR